MKYRGYNTNTETAWSFRDSLEFCVIICRKIEKYLREGKGCFSSPFSHVLGFHNSFLYISNFTDIFIAVQKIISWKAGKSELICLHGGLRFPYIGRMAKNFRADLAFQKQKICDSRSQINHSRSRR